MLKEKIYNLVESPELFEEILGPKHTCCNLIYVVKVRTDYQTSLGVDTMLDFISRQ